MSSFSADAYPRSPAPRSSLDWGKWHWMPDNLYVVGNNACVVWKITPARAVSAFADLTGICGYNGGNISANTAQLNVPSGVAFVGTDQLYIADYCNCLIRKINTSGIITAVAGTSANNAGVCGYSGESGQAVAASLNGPIAVVVRNGSLYIADNSNDVIRKVNGGIITTYAGTGFAGYNGDELAALKTNFDDLVALAADSSGTIYELDDFKLRLRKIGIQ